MYRIGFAIEQVLGHITHASNLVAHVPADPEVEAHWALAPYPVEGFAARVPVYRSNWTLRVGVRTRRLLRTIRRSTKLDAMFFHTQVPAMLCLDYVRKYPTVVSLDATPSQYDELGPYYDHATGSPRVERWKKRGNQRCFYLARHLVTWSEWARQSLIDDYGVAADKVTVIPPGVSVADWQRPEPRHAGTGPVKILFVGGDLERKGGLLLLDAFRELRPLGVELHLVTRDDVAAEDGLFVHHGMQPNSAALKALYHECEIFALPTFGDCLPMVLSEAGAAGMATVSTRLAAIPEVVLDGETGLLVPTGDVVALTGALRTLVTDPDLRLRMGERAVEHVRAHFDTAPNAMRLLTILKREVDRAASGSTS